MSMRLRLTGLKHTVADKDNIGKKNMVWLVKEKNEHGTDGIAWRAEYPRGVKIGYVPELDSVRGWSYPCPSTIKTVKEIRKQQPDIIKSVVIDRGMDWKGSHWIEVETRGTE